MNYMKAVVGAFGISLAFAVRLHAQSFLTNGLVAYYPFNGTTNDASGNGNNGTLYGTDWRFSADRLGNPQSALFLNPGQRYAWSPTLNGAYVVAPRSAALNFSDFTFSVWVNLSTGVTNYQENLISNGMDDVGAVNLFITPGSTLWGGNDQLACGWTGNVIAAPTAPLRDAWFQFAVVKSGATATLFKNGSPLTNQVMQAGVSWINPAFYIGRLQPVPGGHGYTWQLMGGINDVRMYDRALSASEVQFLYAYEAGIHVDLIKAVKPSFSNLLLGTNYQLQVSSDLSTWANQGSPFMATNTSMVYPQYWDAGGKLFFRLLAKVQLYAYEAGLHVDLIKADKPSFSNLLLGTNYQLQVSSDLSTWANQGSPFMATNTSMVYPQYWDVDNWGKLFFRLQVAP